MNRKPFGRLFLLGILCLVVLAAAAFWWLDRDAPASGSSLSNTADIQPQGQGAEQVVGPESRHRRQASQEPALEIAEAPPTEPGRVPANLDREGRLTIRLENMQGEPVAGAPIEVYQRTGFTNANNEEGTTDASGRFPIRSRFPGRIENLTIPASEESPVHVELSLGSQTLFPSLDDPHLLRVRVPHLADLSIQVTPHKQPDGSPWAIWADLVPAPSPDPTVTTLEAGEYGGFYPNGDGVLELTVAFGLYRVYAAEDYENPIYLQVDRYQVDVDLPVRLPTPAPDPKPEPEVEYGMVTLQGHVVSQSTGKALRSEIKDQYQADVPRYFDTWTEPDGSFSIETRRGISHYLGVQAKGYALAFLGPIPETSITNLRVSLLPATTVRGRVLDANGLPATNGRVQLFASNGTLTEGLARQPIETQPLPARGTTLRADNPGHFEFERVPTGSVRLRYLPASPGESGGGTIAQAGDQNILIRCGAGLDSLSTLRGIVTHAGTSKPLQDIRVCLGPLPDISRDTARTDQGGSFALIAIETPFLSGWFVGDPHLEESFVAQEFRRIPLVMGENQISVVMQPATVLHLKVSGADQEPLYGAIVEAQYPNGDRIMLQDAYHRLKATASTAHNGRVDLFGLPENPIRLRIWRGSANFQNGLRPDRTESVAPGNHRLRVIQVRLP